MMLLVVLVRLFFEMRFLMRCVNWVLVSYSSVVIVRRIRYVRMIMVVVLVYVG